MQDFPVVVPHFYLNFFCHCDGYIWRLSALHLASLGCNQINCRQPQGANASYLCFVPRAVVSWYVGNPHGKLMPLV